MGPAQVQWRQQLHLQGDRATSSALRSQCFTACQVVSLIFTVLLTGSVHVKMYYRSPRLGPCSESDMQLRDSGGLRRLSASPNRATLSEQQPGQAPAERDTLLDTLPPGMFNPSIVIHEGEAWAVVRSQYIMPDKRWALGKNHMVQLNLTDWSVKSIHMFDPWQNVTQLGLPCKIHARRGVIDVWGPDDTKLFVWPGNGVWALTAGRPRVQRCIGACCTCTQLVFQQWLVQVARDGEPLDPIYFGKSLQPDPPHDYPGWKLTPFPVSGEMTMIGSTQSDLCGRSTAVGLPEGHGNKHWRELWHAAPLPITLDDAAAVYGIRRNVEEKNWMLFTTGQDLYVTYELAPTHRVYRVKPSGQAEPISDTNSSAVFKFAQLGVPFKDIHGGPSIVHITSTHLQSAGLPDDDYLLGVVHYHERVYYSPDPLYQHFLIKIEPRPPFRVLQLSGELILQFVDNIWWKQQVAFVSGVQVAMLNPRAGNESKVVRPSSAAKHLNSFDMHEFREGDVGLVPHVMFSYGTGDYYSRVLVLTLVEVEQLFATASWNVNSTKQQSMRSMQESSGSQNLDLNNADAVEELTPDPDIVEAIVQRRKDGAALLYWHMQQCGGAQMCSALHKANMKMFSCWALLPASAAPEDAQEECNCSGPEQASFSYFAKEQVQSFMHAHSWVDAFFVNAGMPRDPYFGAKAVQVAVLRDPITRYLAHIVHEGKKYSVPDFGPKLNLSGVAQQRAHEWHWLVPDNYMTRFLCGHWSLQNYGYLSRPVTPGMFEKALANLQRMDIMLVLEEALTPEVGELLTAVGLSPYGLDPSAQNDLAKMYDVSATVLQQVESWHSYDMQLYRYARKRHTELLESWQGVETETDTGATWLQ